jgi:hypothetical protein
MRIGSKHRAFNSERSGYHGYHLLKGEQIARKQWLSCYRLGYHERSRDEFGLPKWIPMESTIREVLKTR